MPRRIARCWGIPLLLVTGLAAAEGAFGSPLVLPARPPVRLQAFATMAHVPESSGIVPSHRFAGLYWTHSDSGGRPALYAVDATGAIQGNPVTVTGAANIDWEDIAADEAGNLWIADIGNNFSLRKDLCVWVVPEPDPWTDRRTPRAQRYPIRYPEQEFFPSAGGRFDAEALFVVSGRAYLLTKRHRDRSTVLYRLGDDPKHTSALVRLDSFEIGDLVTAADVSPDGEILVVLTYGAVWMFRATHPEAWFEGSIRWLPIEAGQCEAVALDRDATLIITNEAGSLFRVPQDELQAVR